MACSPPWLGTQPNRLLTFFVMNCDERSEEKGLIIWLIHHLAGPSVGRFEHLREINLRREEWTLPLGSTKLGIKLPREESPQTARPRIRPRRVVDLLLV